MTPERIKELRKLCEAATPGPWTYKASTINGFGWVNEIYYGDRVNEEVDAKFIAESRSAIPELLDEVQRQKEENQHWATKLVDAYQENAKLRKVVQAASEFADGPCFCVDDQDDLCKQCEFDKALAELEEEK